MFNLLTTSSDTLNIYYVGVAVFLLALYGVLSRHPMSGYFVALTLILGSLSLGENSWVAKVYFDLPTGRWFRWPERYQPLLAFSMATLAAIAMDRIIRDLDAPRPPAIFAARKRWLPMAFPVYALLFIVLWDFYQPSLENGILIVPLLVAVIVTGGSVLTNRAHFVQWITPVILIAYIVLIPTWRFPARLMNPSQKLDLIGAPEEILEHPGLEASNLSRRYVDYATLDGRRIPKFGTLTRTPTLNGFSVFMPFSFWDSVKRSMIERLQTYELEDNPNVPTGLWAGLSIDQGAQNNLDMMGVEHVILGLGQELVDFEESGTTLEKILDVDPYSLWKNSTAWERAFILPDVTAVGTPEQLGVFYAEGVDAVEIRELALNSVTLHRSAAAPAGLLVLTDQYYPGWQVWVDGTERELVSVGDLFRGVQVAGSDTEIEFRYRPWSFYFGAVVTFGTLMVWMAALAFGLLKKDSSTDEKGLLIL